MEPTIEKKIIVSFSKVLASMGIQVKNRLTLAALFDYLKFILQNRQHHKILLYLLVLEIHL